MTITRELCAFDQEIRRHLKKPVQAAERRTHPSNRLHVSSGLQGRVAAEDEDWSVRVDGTDRIVNSWP